MDREIASVNFYKDIQRILELARQKAYTSINSAMVEAYWQIGKRIVDEEQNGKDKAVYGEQLIITLSKNLTGDYGKGFSIANLKNFRQFYMTFPDFGKSYAARSFLSWTHYRLLMRVAKPAAREWYMNEAAEQNWSTRALERQINSLYYERRIMSKDNKPVILEAEQNTSALRQDPAEFMKDPYVLEFLNIKDRTSFRESELEQSIIECIQFFLLELGKGFAFVARQKRVSTETKEFFIDLVFYNYYLKCFILIDLKTGELSHQDIGQMDMYVRMFDDIQKGEDDNPTVGLILCTEKDRSVVKYSVLNENKQLFASKYMLYLPSEEELVAELEREKRLIEMERERRD